MNDQLVKHDTALLARSKYFNWDCDFQYTTRGVAKLTLRVYHKNVYNGDSGEFVPVPTQASLQKWLRDEHKIHIEIMSQGINDHKSYSCQLCMMCNKMPYPWYYKPNDKYSEGFETYEKALEIGLGKALESINV